MRVNSLNYILMLAVVSLPAATLAQESVFSDNFNSESGNGAGSSGESSINHNGFSKWTIESGTVDLIQHQDFGVACADETGKCVDLDGSTSDAGVMMSDPIVLGPGVYELSYMLSGVAESFNNAGAESPNVVDVSVGDLFSEQVTRNQGDPFGEFRSQFSVFETTTAPIAFANQGGDNFGAVLDNVELTLVPEPNSVGLLLAACGGLPLMLRTARK